MFGCHGASLLCQIRCFRCKDMYSWAYPERDMGRLHRLLDDSEQCLPQLIQLHLMTQGGAEGSQHLGRIILAAIEAPINNLLDMMAERLAEGRDRQGGEDD